MKMLLPCFQKHRHRVLTLINIAYLIICFSGFLWQVTEICLLFFAYDVTTHVVYNMPDLFIPPAMTLCHRYFDLLDFDTLIIAHAEKKWTFNSWNSTIIRDVQQSLSIHEILTLTPPANDSISSCSYREPFSFELFEYSDTDCLDQFEIEKFFTLEYICYRYAFRNRTKMYAYHELANTPAAPGQIYRFEVPKAFNNVIMSKFALHPNGRYPYKELEYSIVTSSTRDSNHSLPASGGYKLSYFALETKRLPPPFVTRCINYANFKDGRQGKTDCHQRCVKEKMVETRNRVPFSSIETTDTNMSAISYLDVESKDVVNQLFEFYEECDDECHRPDCDDINYFTRTRYKQRNGNLAFDAYLPNEPSIKVISKEMLTFAQFASIILSTFGTWFGISVMTLNPFQLKSIQKSHCKVRTDSFPKTPPGESGRIPSHHMASSIPSHQMLTRSAFGSIIQRLTPSVSNNWLPSDRSHLLGSRTPLASTNSFHVQRRVIDLSSRVKNIESFVNETRSRMK